MLVGFENGGTMWNPNSPRTADLDEKPVISPISAHKQSQSSLQPTLTESSSIASVHATIGKSLMIKGEITGSEALYIDGQVEGAINLPGNRVTIGPNGEVKATITALEVIVQGKIVGNVNTSGRLEVRSEGSLIGDAVAERINLADGAFFKGKIDVRRPGEHAEPSDAPNLKEPLPVDSGAERGTYVRMG